MCTVCVHTATYVSFLLNYAGTGILEFVKIDPSFTTPKLRAIIQDNVNGSFKLNWISKDKTRVNFESIDDAASILSLMKSSTQVKVTPYTPPEENPQAEKKMPPRGPSVSRLTGKPRPATSDAVARRLIVGHLGLKTKSNGEA
ncbi:hypothetical protein BCR43DRAFT_164844 [Syncephalastrum racemosum]|uniref:Uncharacterized protein n=1 Tax=Syncephalastrum racemosum TaxID=13706 RepID=A0A1X2HNT8_SYNRA|nr:hypothetical protein BCR43DRAFT_164844 [Syncephalastrum racemosum]